MVVESFGREGGNLLVLLAVKYEQFAVVRSGKFSKVRGVGLDVERIQSLCCCDVQDTKVGIIKVAVVVYDVSEPVLSTIS
jgi:hypothetical protein